MKCEGQDNFDDKIFSREVDVTDSPLVILLKFGVNRMLGNTSVFPVVSLPLVCRFEVRQYALLC